MKKHAAVAEPPKKTLTKKVAVAVTQDPDEPEESEELNEVKDAWDGTQAAAKKCEETRSSP